jgi:hypothetical protein
MGAMRWLFALLLALPAALPAQRPSSPEAVGVETLPPLSLGDAELLIHRAQLLLEGYGGRGGPNDLGLARTMLRAVMDFVQLADQRRSTLTDYTFVRLGKGTITPGDASMEFMLTPEEPVTNVQALALSCSRDRVDIQRVVLETPAGETTTRETTLTLNPDMPGRSFLYLPEMISVTQVTIRAFTHAATRPRVTIWLGQTETPEYLRQALAHLDEAQAALDQDNRDRATAEMDLARELISQAAHGEGGE